MDIQQEVMNLIYPKKSNKLAEEKEENELDLEDRLYLVNKKNQDVFLTQLYKNLIDNHNLLYEDNNSQVNDYVYHDVEFLQDHYQNSSNGLITKMPET